MCEESDFSRLPWFFFLVKTDRIKVEEDGSVKYIGDKHKLEQGSTLLHEEHLKEHLEAIVEARKEGEDDEDDDQDDGDDCGSCYGAGEEGECCDSCEDVKRAYQRKGWHLENPDAIVQVRVNRMNCSLHKLPLAHRLIVNIFWHPVGP